MESHLHQSNFASYAQHQEAFRDAKLALRVQYQGLPRSRIQRLQVEKVTASKASNLTGRFT